MAKTFNLKKVACILGGNIITGFADGDAISIEYDEDHWSLTVGADGEGVRSKSNNLAATITIRLLQSSPANEILQNFWNADKIADNGVFPLMIKDNSGNSVHVAAQAWVQKQAPAKYAKEAAEREWVIRTDELIPNEGGN